MPGPQEKLALLGGPKACSAEPRETFPVPAQEVKDAVGRLIDAGVYSTTAEEPYKALEREWAAYCGAKHCLAQNNGTSTLWAALWACGVGPGDEVISSPYTWICSYAAAWQLGARVVFAEMDPETLLLNPRDVEKRITPRTKVILVVHLYGYVADLDALTAIAKQRGIRVVEDCSHAHGAAYQGRKVGTIGDVGCFSMQGSPWGGKALPAGEGGLVVTNDRDLYQRMLFFGHLNRQGMVEEQKGTAFEPFGCYGAGVKFRAHPWSLAAARIFLRSLDQRNAMRWAYATKIHRGVEKLPGIQLRKQPDGGSPAGFYGGMHLLYHPEALGGLPVERFLEALKAEGVDMAHRQYELFHLTAHLTKGFDLQNNGQGPLCGRGFAPLAPGVLPVSEEVHGRILGMPTFIRENPGCSDGVVAAFRKVVHNHRQLLPR